MQKLFDVSYKFEASINIMTVSFTILLEIWCWKLITAVLFVTSYTEFTRLRTSTAFLVSTKTTAKF